MIDHILNHTITVKRSAYSSTNSIGERTKTTSTIYTAIPALVEFTQPKIGRLIEGYEGTYDIRIMTKAGYTITENDIIVAVSVPTYASNEIVGRVKKAVPAFQMPLSAVHHLELEIEKDDI